MTFFCACKSNKDIQPHIPLSMYNCTQNLWHFNQNNRTCDANAEQKDNKLRNTGNKKTVPSKSSAKQSARALFSPFNRGEKKATQANKANYGRPLVLMSLLN